MSKPTDLRKSGTARRRRRPGDQKQVQELTAKYCSRFTSTPRASDVVRAMTAFGASNAEVGKHRCPQVFADAIFDLDAALPHQLTQRILPSTRRFERKELPTPTSKKRFSV